MQATNNQTQYKLRRNQQIRIPQVRLILSDGSNGGVMATYEALKLAQNENLDLVEINPRATPPVAKICNYGKMLYDEKKKLQAEKKKQQNQELKELTLRPVTDENDLNHKLEQAKGFLAEGHRVKFTIRFRGREIAHTDLGKEKINYILEQLKELIQPNPPVALEGKFMSVITSPIKNKA